MSFNYRNIVPFAAHPRFALILFLFVCPITYAVGYSAKTQINNKAGPEPPAGLQGTQAQEQTKNPSYLVFVHFGGALVAGSLLGAATLRMRYRRFIGLGVFTNQYSVLFVSLAALLCGLPRTSVSALASYMKPSVASWAADFTGVFLTLILGTRVRAPKSSSEGGAIQDLASPVGSNVIFAAIEEGIRDHLLTRMQLVLVDYARRYTWEVIENAGQRTIDEEVAVGRLSRKDGEASMESIKALRSPRDRKTEVDRKYRAIVRLLSCCPLSRLGQALARGQA